MRALAAFLVLILHSGLYIVDRLHPKSGQWLWVRGAKGVDLFFVLSGFMMVYSSQRLFGNPKGWKIFAEKRITRIVPMYWIATTIKVAALLIGSTLILHSKFNLISTVASYLFIPTRNDNGLIAPVLLVGWTLNFEMFFYMIFAVALKLRVNVYIFVASILFPLAVASVFRQPSWPAPSFYLNPVVPEFFFGMLIAKWILSGKKMHPALATVLVFGGLIWMLFLPVPEPYIISFYGVAAALAIWGTAALEPKLGWLPKWVLYLGDASYVLYLFHDMIAPAAPVILKRIHMPYPPLSMALSIVMSVVICCGIHQYVEKPITERLRKWSAQRRTQPENLIVS